MKYTIFEQLQLPNKGLRFYTSFQKNEKDDEFNKIVGHTNTDIEALKMCDDIDEEKLPSVDVVHDFHVNTHGKELGEINFWHYMIARTLGK
jgi:hypothetical protein